MTMPHSLRELNLSPLSVARSLLKKHLSILRVSEGGGCHLVRSILNIYGASTQLKHTYSSFSRDMGSHRACRTVRPPPFLVKFYSESLDPYRGIYDTEYLTYIRSLLSLLPQYGIAAFVSIHQDVWSRYSGGSGAPAWTLEL